MRLIQYPGKLMVSEMLVCADKSSLQIQLGFTGEAVARIVCVFVSGFFWVWVFFLQNRLDF